MKKILLIGACMLLLQFVIGSVAEAQSCSVGTGVETIYRPPGFRILDLAWTSTAGGAVTCETSRIDGYVTYIVTNPGATAPTDDYDIVLSDSDGIDISDGLLANRDTANTEQVIPVVYDTGATDVFGSRAIFGPLTIAITNAGNALSGTLKIYFE